MNFHEVRFPAAVAFHSTGGPVRKTEIVTLGSGYEERNAVWAGSRRSFDVGSGIRSLDDLHAVIAFFEARLGRLYGFRFKDFSDWKSCAPGLALSPMDQQIAVGDGTTKVFPLIKTYASGPAGWTRKIQKPVEDTVRIAVAGSELVSGFFCDATSGLVSFTAAPANGAPITAGYEFDCAVRFDTDALSVNLAGFASGEAPSIPLMELLL
jgi:uncharacterized protein (TIGR02217 family)